MPKNTEDIPVIVKPLAYYKMLVHVLRFGSKVKDPTQCKEVMGGLIGHIDEKDGKKFLIIEDAIPVSHGGAIEVRYSPEQLGAFAEIDNKVFEEHGHEGWFSCGWYHSHPNLTPFFSGTDVQNQLFWQAKNPSGIGLVFDHNLLETPGDLGFRAFRLDDPTKSRGSGYHEVKAIVEPPDNVDFYNKIIELIQNLYTGEAPILELNETTDFFEDLYIPKKEDLMVKKPEFSATAIIKSFQEGFSLFLKHSLDPFMDLLNNWSQKLLKNVFINNMNIREDLVQLKLNLSKNMMEIQKNFNYSLHDKMNSLDFYISDKLDVYNEKIDNSKNYIVDFSNKLKNLLKESFSKKLEEKLDDFFKKFEESLNLFNNNNDNLEKVSELLKNNRSNLQELTKELERVKSQIQEDFSKISDKFVQNISKYFNKIDKEIQAFDVETRKLFEDLKAIVLIIESTKEPIFNKIKSLEEEREKLIAKIKELKKENENLSQKIKKFEKEVD